MEERRHFPSAKSRGRGKERQGGSKQRYRCLVVAVARREFCYLRCSGCEIQHYHFTVGQKLWIFSYIRKYRKRV